MLLSGKHHRGPEQRRSVRRKLGLPAQIDCGGGLPPQGCILSDVSATGAKLIANTAADLPEQFDLLLAGETGPRRRSLVVWRSKNEVGVRFIVAAQR
jgi:hypothetical protein